MKKAIRRGGNGHFKTEEVICWGRNGRFGFSFLVCPEIVAGMRIPCWLSVLLFWGFLLGTAGQSAAAPPVSLEPVLWEQLAERVRETVRGFSGVLGIEIVDLTSGQRLGVHEQVVFATASAIKTALLVTAIDKLGTVEGDALSIPYVVRTEDLVPSSPILSMLTPGETKLKTAELLGIMIATSDNTATNVLIGRVGMDAVNRFVQRAGLGKTKLARKMLDGAAVKRGDENVSTAHDLVLLYEKLWRGQLFDKARTEEALRILSVDKHGYLEAGLPDDDDVVVYSKPGSLPGLRVDAGIVRAGDRPFAIAVMAAMPKVDREAELVIEKLASDAFSHFHRLSQSTPYGRHRVR